MKKELSVEEKKVVDYTLEAFFSPNYAHFYGLGELCGRVYSTEGVPLEIAMEHKPEYFKLGSNLDYVALVNGFVSATTKHKIDSGISVKRLEEVQARNRRSIIRAYELKEIDTI